MSPRTRLAAMIAAWLLLSCAFYACTRARLSAAVTPPPIAQPPSAKPAERVATGEALVADLERQLNAARADLAQARREQQVERIRTACTWATGLAVLGLLGSIVAAVMLAPLRRLAILGGLAALAVIIAAQTLAWLAPYLLAVGLVLTAVGIVVLVVILRRRDRDAGQKGDALERVVRLYEWAKEQMPQVDREERRAIQASLVGPASAVVDATRARLGLKP